MIYNLVDIMKPEFNLALKTTHRLCETINTPRSLAVSLMLQYGCWEDYMELTIDPDNYEDPRHFALDYLVSEILRKSPYLPLQVDRQQVALNSFIESEALCYNTNLRLRQQEDPDWLNAFQRNLVRVLGPLTGSVLEFIEDRFRFGPGASTGVKGLGSVVSDKYEKPLHMTAELLPFFKSIIGPLWHDCLGKTMHVIKDGNKFTTVPKTAKTDRGICVEPTLNMYVQLGVGAYIRKRLKLFGIDLNSQSKNQQFAQRAYRDNLCTIDLSAASDSLASGLVLRFFPERWVHLLYICRSGLCDTPRGVIELEKWSSMGNGYTFELETLVFYALCMTIVPPSEMGDVSVYGDDIILPQAYARRLIDALEFLGFRVNQRKSFLAGSFYESCGHDYFKGQNVRPFYLKSENRNLPFSVQIANKLRLYCRRLNSDVSCDNTFEDIWRDLVRVSPRVWRKCRVPLSFGDTGIISDYSEMVLTKPRNGYEGIMVRHIIMTPIKRRKTSFGVYLSALSRLRGSSSEEVIAFILEGRKSNLNSFDDAGSFTKGREPVRGLFGKPRTRWAVHLVQYSGLTWADPLE